MRLNLITLGIILLCSFAAVAQNNIPSFSIKGAAVDTEEMAKLYDASVTVLNAKDSILRKFTRATENGSFAISGIPAGKYILLISYPDYADYVEQFTVDPAHPTHDFGKLNMRLKEKILKEVLIKGEVKAIKISGDTTEFNPKAYVIQPNDKVEDLIKQLPGMQVDKDGKITYNGESVQKVLLDGEEFFGDDPTLVTKNIRADMVDKLQVFDKKSDQAAFTGIDDGVRTKTINVVLKEDKKKGTFGKAIVGVGDHGYYEGQAMYNHFTANSKVSLYGTTANDGTTGLGFADQNKIGSSGSNIISIDGGIGIIAFGDDFQSGYNGQGLPLSRTIGGHYDDKWNKGNSSINANYKAGSLETNGDYFSQQQQSLPITSATLPGGDIHNVNQNKTFDNYSFKQKADIAYQTKFDTSATLKVTADASIRNTHNKDNSVTTTTDGNNALLNNSTLTDDKSTNEHIADFTALYSKKLKRGRTFSWNVSETYDDQTGTGLQMSNTKFYQNSVLDSTSIVNQSKPIHTVSSVLNSNMTFTTPISKKFALTFNYGFALNNSTSDKDSYNQDASGNYTILDPVYSSDYKFNQLTNQLGAVFNYRYNKVTLNFGGKASDVDFTQTDERTSNVYKRSFVNLLPQADLNYRIGQTQNLTVRYNGNTTQPTIDQIQPIATNANPLNITIGNANLRPSFTNRFNFLYNQSKIVSQESFFVNGNYSFTSDPITSNTVTNAAGQSTTQYVNIFDHTPFNYGVNLTYGRKIPFIDSRLSLGLGTNGNIGYSYINNVLNRTGTTNYRVSLNFNKAEAKKYNFFLYGGPTYALNTNSVLPGNNYNAWGFNGNASGSVYLPAKFIISSNVYDDYRGATRGTDALTIVTWDADISKTFFKDDNLKISLAAKNILNQNSTLNRSVTTNSISQSYYSTLQRYFMLSVSWDFTKFGTTSTPAK